MKNTKQLFLISIFFLFPFSLISQTHEKNYVMSTAYQIATDTDVNIPDDQKIESITYIDGLGRPKQNINLRAGGNRQDLIEPIEYDDYGRQIREYLPFPVIGNNGDFYESTNSTVSDLINYYSNKFEDDFDPLTGMANPYDEKRFESFTSNRLIEQAASGSDWKIGNHTIRMEYDTNTLSDQVKKFSVNFEQDKTSKPVLTYDGVYQSNKLFYSKTKDENWQSGNEHTSLDFINKIGQVLLKRTFSNGTIDNYYVYDDFGRLTFVIPPEASDKIIVNGSLAFNFQDILDNYCFQYRYDSEGRIIEKRIPNRNGWDLFVYNNLGQVALTQTPNLRQNNKWLFTKYDEFGRVIYKGITNSILSSREDLDAIVESSGGFEDKLTNPISISGTQVYYTNNLFPTASSIQEVFTVNYYDEYIDHTGVSIPNQTFGVSREMNPKGLPTVSKIKILGTNDWITSIKTYDEKERVIWAYSKNEFLETTDITRSKFDFTGKVIESYTTHSRNGNSTIGIRDYYHYDHLGRLLTQKQKIGNEPIQLITENRYDDIGQLIRKDVGGETYLDGYSDLTYVDATSDGTVINTYPNGWDENWPSRLKTRGEIPEEYDGGIKAKVNQNNKHLRVGLVKRSNSNQQNQYFDYGMQAFYDPQTQQSSIKLVLGNIHNTGTSYGTYNTGDTFKVQRIGNTIYFYKNSSVIHSISITDNEDALVGKVSFTGPSGASVSNLTLFGPQINKKLQNIDYKYNVRGWLTGINDFGDITRKNNDLFRYRINYNNPIEGNLSSLITPVYNRNISQIIWQTANTDNQKRTYGYKYDAINRILAGYNKIGNDLSSWDTNSVTDINYDKNGNIQQLKRLGFGNGDGVWDDLVYNYQNNSNKLLSVTDNAITSLKTEGFNDGTNSGNDYTYDANGNLKTDTNKNITSIDYNHLNLPTKINVLENGILSHIDYRYDALGNKLERITSLNSTSNSTVVTTQYAGGFIYRNDEPGADFELKFFSHPVGYVLPLFDTRTNTRDEKSVKKFDIDTGQTTYSDYKYVFNYTDFWGNVRLSYSDLDENGSIDSSAEIIDEKNYYPYGLEHKGYNEIVNLEENNLRQYQGQEFTQDLNINIHEWRYRTSDVSLGRFWQLDPLSDKYTFNSPFAFQENRLGMGRELEGLEIWFGNPLETWNAVKGVYSTVEGEVTGTWDFITRDAWRGETYVGLGNLTLGVLTSGVPGQPGNVGNLYAVDAYLGSNTVGAMQGVTLAFDDFSNDLINGNTQERAAAVTSIVLLFSPGKLDDISKLNKIVKFGNLTSASSETVKLYRAVSSAELEDISNFGLRIPQKNGYELGKLFTDTPENASIFGRQNFKFDAEPNTIIEVEFPKESLKNILKFQADFKPAFSVPVFEFQNAINISPLNYSPLIKF